MTTIYGRKFPRRSSATIFILTLTATAVPLLPKGRGGRMAPVAMTSETASSQRVLAIADVHGAYQEFLGVLKRMGLIDDNLKWTGGSTILVQVGDVPDRGPETRKALDLLMELEREAPLAGGKVIPLLGNHEVMQMMGDTRYTTPADFQSFATDQSESVRDAAYQDYRKFIRANPWMRDVPDDEASHQQWLAVHPLGFFEERDAYAPAAIYGRWLRTHDAIAQLGDVLFMHAGLDPELHARSVEDMNKKIRSEIADFDKLWQELASKKVIWRYMTLAEAFNQVKLRYEAAKAGAPAALDDTEEMRRMFEFPKGLLISDHSPLWYRGLALEPEERNEKGLTEELKRLHAHYIVVGHTVLPVHAITARFAGRVFLIDTGMNKSYYAGRASALEIEGGKFTAYYADDPSPHVLVGGIGQAAAPVCFLPGGLSIGSQSESARLLPPLSSGAMLFRGLLAPSSVTPD
jgi:calcineurin-like phosphoesterase family protein